MENSISLMDQLHSFYSPTGDIHKIEDYKEDILLNSNGLKGFDAGVSTCINHYIKDKVEIDMNELNEKYKDIECYWTKKDNQNILIFVLNLYDKYYYFSLNDNYWELNTQNKTYH